MYAPPPDGYAWIVWRYELITITISAETATAIGTVRDVAAALAVSSTIRISSVA